MNNVTRAMAADLASRSQAIFSFMVGPLILPVLWWFLFQFTELDLKSPEMTITIARLASFNTFFIATLFVNSAMLRPRQFLLPITTMQLVMHQLLFAWALSIITSVEMSFVQNWIFDRSFSYLTPALFGSAGGMCIWTAVCMTKDSNWKWVIPPFVCMGLAGWYIGRFVVVPPERTLLPMPVVDLFLLLTLVAISFWLLIGAVKKNRCGDILSPIPFPTSIGSYWNSVMPGQRFRSPAQALFWLEWQKFGWLVPLLAIGVTIITFVSWYFSNGDPNRLLIGYSRSWLGVGLIGGMLVALRTVIVVTSSEKQDDLKIPTFLSSLPMTNRQFAQAVFTVIGANGLFILGIWIAGLTVAYLATPKQGLLTMEILPDDFRWWQIPGAVIFYWMIAALFSTLLLTGSRSFIFGFSILLTTGSLASIILLGRLIPDQLRIQIIQSGLNLLGVACIAITAIAFWKACHSRLIPISTAFFCAIAWLTLSIFVSLGWERSLHERVSFFTLGMGLVALVVAPFAMTPIAVSWNRCR